LFRALPADPGMAFVVVEHLNPNHPSMLSELIAKATKLPVEEVKAGLTIRRNHVYVIPPNAFMTVSEEVFSLTDRTKELGQHLAVNHFMRSPVTHLRSYCRVDTRRSLLPHLPVLFFYPVAPLADNRSCTRQLSTCLSSLGQSTFLRVAASVCVDRQILLWGTRLP
jgi:CheB methylesterase